MDELLALKAELNQIRLKVDRSNPYMRRVLEELADEPVEKLRAYFEDILKKEISIAEKQHYERLLQLL